MSTLTLSKSAPSSASSSFSLHSSASSMSSSSSSSGSSTTSSKATSATTTTTTSGATKLKPSYKHIPHSQKPPHLVAKRNARERRRVQAVNQAFYKLRKCVPIENRNKRVSKVKTLQRAIDYIRKLERILECPSPAHDDDNQATSGQITGSAPLAANANASSETIGGQHLAGDPAAGAAQLAPTTRLGRKPGSGGRRGRRPARLTNQEQSHEARPQMAIIEPVGDYRHGVGAAAAQQQPLAGGNQTAACLYYQHSIADYGAYSQANEQPMYTGDPHELYATAIAGLQTNRAPHSSAYDHYHHHDNNNHHHHHNHHHHNHHHQQQTTSASYATAPDSTTLHYQDLQRPPTSATTLSVSDWTQQRHSNEQQHLQTRANTVQQPVVVCALGHHPSGGQQQTSSGLHGGAGYLVDLDQHRNQQHQVGRHSSSSPIVRPVAGSLDLSSPVAGTCKRAPAGASPGEPRASLVLDERQVNSAAASGYQQMLAAGAGYQQPPAYHRSGSAEQQQQSGAKQPIGGHPFEQLAGASNNYQHQRHSAFRAEQSQPQQQHQLQHQHQVGQLVGPASRPQMGAQYQRAGALPLLGQLAVSVALDEQQAGAYQQHHYQSQPHQLSLEHQGAGAQSGHQHQQQHQQQQLHQASQAATGLAL